LAHYFEIYRVSAFIRANNDDLLGAEGDYKTALDLEPDNTRLLFFYAGFLVRYMQDAPLALPYAEKAFSLRPDSVETATLYARCIGYAGDYPKALELLHHLLTSENTSSVKNKKVITTLIIGFHQRHSEDERSIKKDYQRAITTVQKGLNTFNIAVREGYVDDRLLQELGNLFNEYRNVIEQVNDSAEKEIYRTAVREHSEYLVQAGRAYLTEDPSIRATQPHTNTDTQDIRIGKAVERFPDRQYAYVECHRGERFFFHLTNLQVPEEWESLHNESLVRFEVGSNLKGACAINVRVLDRLDHAEEELTGHAKTGNVQSGTITEYYPSRPYAFIKSTNGNRYYFHRTTVARGVAWNDLADGAPVSFVLGRKDNKSCAMEVVIIQQLPSEDGNTVICVGKVVEYYSERTYAFLQCSDGSRYFFHKSNMKEPLEWKTIRNGLFASFTPGTNTAGVCATEVSILNDAMKVRNFGSTIDT
jgi:cold shock CspA family protein